MSLYDIAVGDGGQQDRGAALLAVLGNPHVARYRDAWVEKSTDGPVIAVYTRQGGGNRECYCDGDPATHVPGSCYAACNEALAAHPLYLRDADDDFDATYATFYFRVPDERRADLEAAAVDPVNMSERWLAAIDAIGKEPTSPAMTALGDQLGAMLADQSPDAPRVMEV